jgi:hypothetical protein
MLNYFNLNDAFVVVNRTFMPRASIAFVRALCAGSVAALASFASPVFGQVTAPLTKDLPSIETVLQHVRTMAPQEQSNDALFRSRYSFVRKRTTRELDAKGNIKKQQTKESRNNPPFKPASYHVPVQPAAANTNDVPKQPRKTEPRAFERNEFVLNEDLLSRFDFAVVGREQVNGRNAVVVQFKPKSKDLPTRNLKDRFINKAAGTVWVDEGDWLLAKVDLYLTESVNVIGGLVGAVKKFNYRFDRDRTSDGLWYTTKIDWRLEGRELFSRKILEYEERRSEVQKVH